MKKRIALLFLCVLLLLSVCACSASEEPAETFTPTTAPTPITPASPTAEPEPPAPKGTPLSSAFWSLSYPDGWEMDKKGVNEETKYANVTIGIPSEDDKFSTSVYVAVSIEGPDNFRDAIKDAGLDLYDIIENGNATHAVVGGVDCITYESTYGANAAQYYRARVESAGATVTLRVSGDLGDEGAQAVLESLQFELPDTGNVDPPYSWNGTPFTAEPASIMVGNVTLQAEQLPFAESLVVDDIFSGRIGLVGNQLYLLLDEKLAIYNMDGNTLTHAADVPLEKRYTEMTVCDNGVAYLSASGSPLLAIQDGTVIGSYDGPRNVSMHPSGDWGINYFTTNEIEKLTFKDGVMSTEPIVLEELQSIRSITVCDDYVFVAGGIGEDNDHGLVVYDTKLKHELTMRDEDADPNGPKYLGSITHAFKTDNGFIALDGNMREIHLWTKDGAFIGSAEVPELFSASYAWLSGAYLQEDGTILVGITQERDDHSADEFVLFRLTGF